MFVFLIVFHVFVLQIGVSRCGGKLCYACLFFSNAVDLCLFHEFDYYV